MEQTETVRPPFLFKRFFLRSWLTNLVFTFAFGVIVLYCYQRYTATTATRTVFLLNIGALLVCWTHTLLLLIFAIRRFIRKNALAGLCFLVHFLLSLTIAYYLYVYLALFGWLYAMKGH